MKMKRRRLYFGFSLGPQEPTLSVTWELQVPRTILPGVEE
jgi:hypothetical protein